MLTLGGDAMQKPLNIGVDVAKDAVVVVGLDDRTIRALIKGAFLHDVGKIGIQDHSCSSPGPDA